MPLMSPPPPLRFQEPACNRCIIADVVADYGPRVATGAAAIAISGPPGAVRRGQVFDVSAILFDAFDQNVRE